MKKSNYRDFGIYLKQIFVEISIKFYAKLVQVAKAASLEVHTEGKFHIIKHN